MNAPGCSVLVISSGRDGHLANLIAGINRSTLMPAELVVAYMGQPDPPPVDAAVPLRVVHCPVSESRDLPLAAARNAAAAAATTENLVFLDVDCIPSRTMFQVLTGDLQAQGGIVMAQPRYLRAGLSYPACSAAGLSAHDDDALISASVTHPARRGLTPGDGAPPLVTDRYELFWSLGFAVTAGDFAAIGGFDESFRGYGAEDTDFAFTARKHSVGLSFSSATMFHQHHGVTRPPLQHFAAIVENSTVFHRKWGIWPMTGWLGAFAAAGYIEWTGDSAAIDVIRHPSVGDIDEASVDSPY